MDNKFDVLRFLKLYKNGEFKAVFDYCIEFAEQGDEGAQFVVATCYEDGIGVEKNIDEAGKWYIRSAEQGDSSAQYNLGLYYESTGLEENEKEAVKWYIKAAEVVHKT